MAMIHPFFINLFQLKEVFFFFFFFCTELAMPTSEMRLDPSVLREFPEGSSVLSTDTHKISFWAKVGRINVLLANNTEKKAYFIKVVSGDVGRNMVMSEFESLRAIHQIIPEFVPTPIAWGSYETVPDTHFILSQFRNMTGPDTMPDPENFTALLAKLHEESESPDGRFGFHVTTYPGNLPQYTGWEESWETFFTKTMRQTLNAEIDIRGRTNELDALSQALFDKVIPRLLRPLESDGRSVKPSLVHGDLWYGNAGTDIETGECLVFDPCCFYAHNECECAHFEPAAGLQTKTDMGNTARRVWPVAACLQPIRRQVHSRLQVIGRNLGTNGRFRGEAGSISAVRYGSTSIWLSGSC
jgi:protein-ribulosamine 3-kinase